MEDTDHKDVWQCGTFPWSQSLLVGFGIGALLAYNFVQRRLGCFRPNWIKRKWSWSWFDYRRRFYCWSSFAGNVFLVTGSFDCFDRFRGAVNSRISTAKTVNVTQYLLITRRVWAIVNEDITKRSFRFLKISWHESREIFVKHSFRNDTDLFSIARTSEKSHLLSIPADVRV